MWLVWGSGLGLTCDLCWWQDRGDSSVLRSVCQMKSLGAEQSSLGTSSPLNLAPLETRVLNQSTNGLHLSLSFSLYLLKGWRLSYHHSRLRSMSESLYDFNRWGCVIITRIKHQDLAILILTHPDQDDCSFLTLTLLISARLLTHKDGIWLSCKLAKRGKYCRRFLNSFFSARQQSLVTGTGVGCWLSRDDHNNSWHNHDIMTLLAAYFSPPGTTQIMRNWIRNKLFFQFDLFQRNMHCNLILENPLCHTKRFEIAPSPHLRSRDSRSFLVPGPRVGALGPGQLSRAHSEHINT